MKKIIYLFLCIGAMVFFIFFLLRNSNLINNEQGQTIPSVSDLEEIIPEKKTDSSGNADNQEKNSNDEVAVVKNSFQFPMNRATERVSKKPFGIFVTPKNSPVSPEKFSGYHTAVDFEIFSEELEEEVFVKAVCSGKLLVRRIATGYGGLAVQSCDLEGNPITVIYGHLKLDSIKVAPGDNIVTGEDLGMLGRAYSAESGGERKHLHLGFHKGSEINILGYVSSKELLSNWLDPMLFIK